MNCHLLIRQVQGDRGREDQLDGEAAGGQQRQRQRERWRVRRVERNVVHDRWPSWRRWHQQGRHSELLRAELDRRRRRDGIEQYP